MVMCNGNVMTVILLSLHYHYHYILITQNITVITLPLHFTSSLHRILLSLHYHYTLPLHITSSLHRILLSLHYHYKLHPHYTEYYCHYITITLYICNDSNILCNEDVKCNGNVMTVIFCVMRM
jgi:hypothetical protein